MLSTYTNKLFDRCDLNSVEMEESLRIITGGEVPHSQIGAFLAALRMKGVSCSELVGAARMLRRAATFIDCGQREVVDVVGTGGDGSNSFNISTSSAFVAAGAGVTVAKHGNRAASSRCGSADVLAALGYNLDAPIPIIEHEIIEHGIGFLYAAKMHPTLGSVAVIRRELKIRTIFNMIGPLCNPAGAKAIVLGVYAPELTELFAAALRELGVRRALVVHGMEGIDEISCCGPTRVTELKDGEIRTSELLPELLVGECYDPAEIVGGTPEENAVILRSVLDGTNAGGPRASVLLNAGATIYVAGGAPTLRDGIRKAVVSIDSGVALSKLEQLIKASHGKSA
ncbi:MAG: anthranilate phosphoribosyltransferase [Victivallales bacterium]|jgi:anthranilate phosphoribosyltransferase|nr:anthranilate phosphoribosyltransferase [Victivallales bacterium]